ncbi:glycoside hydrolase family 16 protein [Labedaea rhizosphaerae]|uniref:Beta-glucanase (GH16 family) n=1 Tax=Labedaea rhizosphaerae TaxID=598644 RepID=A0A4R6S404_LABRH|nr:glycoside hydrolase family 16 protein [Labedaea rhizosphaerae]TDP94023.1 beta-glucanase (GH16 family) [Labedaea rhizosphaerae]
MSALRRPRRLALLGAAVLGAALAISAGHATAATTSPALAAASFTDDFNGPSGAAVDGSKWHHEIGNGADGWGNHELEYYTDGTANAALDGQGHLVITAKRENYGNCWNGTCQYTSAKFSTPQTFSQAYGHFEARMQLPRGQGMWPAFWMLGNDIGTVGWPNSGEIDIMENIGKEPGSVHGTIHGPGYSGAGGIGAGYTLPGGQAFADGFHTFAVDWAPNSITWSVDGNAYETRTPADLNGNRWVFDHPFYIIMNLAVGGYWPGNPDGSTSFPQRLVVDYVHVTTGSTTPPTGHQIVGLAGKCMDVYAANPANGTPVQLYDCNGTNAQAWTATNGTLQALGKCLDATSGGTADGTPLQLYDCNGTGAQKFTLNSAHDIVNSASGKCVDVTGNNSANGTRLQLWTCTGGANQKWTMS